MDVVARRYVDIICEFWTHQYLNLDNSAVHNYEKPTWTHRIYPVNSDEEQMFKFNAVWECPCVQQPISQTTALVHFSIRQVENEHHVSFRYESLQSSLTHTWIVPAEKDSDPQQDEPDWERTLKQHIKDVCDQSLFNPQIQLSQIMESKKIVRTRLQNGEWLKGQVTYATPEEMQQRAHHIATNDPNTYKSAPMKDLMQFVPKKVADQLNFSDAKQVEFNDRIARLLAITRQDQVSV